MLLAPFFTNAQLNQGGVEIFDIAKVKSTLSANYSEVETEIAGAGGVSYTQAFTLNKAAHFATYGANKRVISAKLFVQVYYDKVLLNGASPMVSNVSLSALDASSTPISSFFSEPMPIAFAISDVTPKQLFYKDITSQINNVEEFVVTFRSTAPSLIPLGLNRDDLKVEMWYEIEYGLDVVATALPIFHLYPNPSAFGNRNVSFKWNHITSSNKTTEYVPGYEFQMIRVFNEDPTLLDEDVDGMKGDIDWSKAMKFNIENRDHMFQAFGSIPITVSEGKGMYVWRVRQVGNYYEGFFANDKNYGSWSHSTPDFDIANIQNPAEYGFFYLNDPDYDKNWIYSRTFSEENKTSESMGYANKLLQRKQTQTYLPSNGETFISQSIYDYKGRAAVNTLPVPKGTSDGITQYQDNVFNNTSGNVYRDRDFDKTTVDPMQGNVHTNYYQNNSTNAIGNADGFPMTVARFTNDGTGRVAEESGVGATHRIGQGHTVEYDYGLSGDEELIRVFGDEAPRGDRIKKTVVYDQNGVATVTYTNFENKVIATALSSSDQTTQFDDDGLMGDDFSVQDVLQTNFEDANGNYISTKRMAITQCTPLTITYDGPSGFAEICGVDAEIDCEYDLKITIHNLKDASKSITTNRVSTITASSFVASDFYYLETFNTNKTAYVQPICPNVPTGTTLRLEQGSYLIEKRIIPVKANAQATVDAAVSTIKQRVQRVADQLIDDLNEIENEQDYNDFVDDKACLIYKYVTWTEVIDGVPVDKWDYVSVKCEDIVGYDYNADGRFKYDGTNFKTYFPNRILSPEECDITELNYFDFDNTPTLSLEPEFLHFAKCQGDILVYTPAPTLDQLFTTMHITSECCDMHIPVIYMPDLACPHLGKMREYMTNYTSASNDATALEDVYDTQFYFSSGIVTNTDGFEHFDLGFSSYMFTLFNGLGLLKDANGDPIIVDPANVSEENKMGVTLADINHSSIPVADQNAIKLSMWEFLQASEDSRITMFLPMDNSLDLVNYGTATNSLTWDKTEYLANFDQYIRDLDEMVYHMINDRYRDNAENLIYDEQYECEDVMGCWQGALQTVINAKLNIDVDDFSVTDPIGEMNKDDEVEFEIDDEKIKEAVDKAFDDMTFGWFLKMFGKKKREEAIEDAVDEAEASVYGAIDALDASGTGGVDAEFKNVPLLMDMFFDCAGLKLARVLNTTGGGDYACTGALFGSESDFTNFQVNDNITYGTGGNEDTEGYGYAYDQRDQSLWNGAGVDKDKFERIYAFKYYLYTKGLQAGCEINYCFCPGDPVNCTPPAGLDLCVEYESSVECENSSHFKWNFIERENFLNCVKKDLGNIVNPAQTVDYQDMTCADITDGTITLDMLHTAVFSDVSMVGCGGSLSGCTFCPSLLQGSCGPCISAFDVLMAGAPFNITNSTVIDDAFRAVTDAKTAYVFPVWHPLYGITLPNGSSHYEYLLGKTKCEIIQDLYWGRNTNDVIEFINNLNGGYVTWQDIDSETQQKEDECTNVCNSKEPLYKQKVTEMFEANCWTLVNSTCTEYQNWEVPAEDVTKIATTLVTQCKSMCKLEFVAAQSKECYDCDRDPITNNPKQYVEVYQGSPEELRRWKAVMEGHFKLDITSWCTPGTKTFDQNINPYNDIVVDNNVVRQYYKCAPLLETDDLGNTTNLDYDANNLTRCNAEVQDDGVTPGQLNSNTIFNADSDGDGEDDQSDVINVPVTAPH